MKLDSVRCGCGTVYRPTVRTQQACEACGDRQRAQARAQLGEQPQQYSSETHKWRTLVAGKGITIAYDAGPTVIGGPGIIVAGNQVVTVTHQTTELDLLGQSLGKPRQLIFKDESDPFGTYKLANLETDEEYRARLHREAWAPIALKLTVNTSNE